MMQGKKTETGDRRPETGKEMGMHNFYSFCFSSLVYSECELDILSNSRSFSLTETIKGFSSGLQ